MTRMCWARPAPASSGSTGEASSVSCGILRIDSAGPVLVRAHMLRAVVLAGASGQVVGCWGELDETARQRLRETARRRLDGHETWAACDWLVRHYGDVLFRASDFSGLVADHLAAALDVVESGDGFDAFYAAVGGVRARGSQSRDSRRRQARELMRLAPGMTDYAVRTIGRDVPPVEVWERWNQEFMQALSKRWPMVWVMWSLAVQLRQAPHWDDLVGGIPDGLEREFWRWYRDEWLRISGDGGSPGRSRAESSHHRTSKIAGFKIVGLFLYFMLLELRADRNSRRVPRARIRGSGRVAGRGPGPSGTHGL